MQISVSSALTVYHDGQFWVGLAEHVEDGRYGAARIVFGAEPSNEEILRFVVNKWAKLSFFGHDSTEASKPAKNPKRRAREVSKAFKHNLHPAQKVLPSCMNSGMLAWMMPSRCWMGSLRVNRYLG